MLNDCLFISSSSSNSVSATFHSLCRPPPEFFSREPPFAPLLTGKCCPALMKLTSLQRRHSSLHSSSHYLQAHNRFFCLLIFLCGVWGRLSAVESRSRPLRALSSFYSKESRLVRSLFKLFNMDVPYFTHDMRPSCIAQLFLVRRTGHNSGEHQWTGELN